MGVALLTDLYIIYLLLFLTCCHGNNIFITTSVQHVSYCVQDILYYTSSDHKLFGCQCVKSKQLMFVIGRRYN